MQQFALYPLMLAPVAVVIVLGAVMKRRQRLKHGTRTGAFVRTASLRSPEAHEKGWLWALLSTGLVQAATAAVLALRWQTIPRVFPVHWGLSGGPNRWVSRSFGSVFGPLLLAAVLVGCFALLGELIARSSPGGRRPHRNGTHGPRVPRRVFLASHPGVLFDQPVAFVASPHAPCSVPHGGRHGEQPGTRVLRSLSRAPFGAGPGCGSIQHGQSILEGGALLLQPGRQCDHGSKARRLRPYAELRPTHLLADPGRCHRASAAPAALAACNQPSLRRTRLRWPTGGAEVPPDKAALRGREAGAPTSQ